MNVPKHLHSALDVVRVDNSGLVLAAGFGGLLLLMAFGGVDAVQALRRIQLSNDTIRDDFVVRTRMLERIRGDLYISGTYVRDYLLEPDPGRAEGHRFSLLETRSDMDVALQAYRKLLTPPETTPFQVLTGELATYWKVLEPVFEWSADRRKRDGYGFLRDEVFRRRMSMLGIADQIASMNELQLDAGKAKVETTFLHFRRRLATTVILTMLVGMGLAGFISRRILVLEANNAAHFRQIAKAQAELKQLSARLVQAQESERRSLSRELHDEVGQSMTGNPGGDGQSLDFGPRRQLAGRGIEGRRDQETPGGLDPRGPQHGVAAAAVDARRSGPGAGARVAGPGGLPARRGPGQGCGPTKSPRTSRKSTRPACTASSRRRCTTSSSTPRRAT